MPRACKFVFALCLGLLYKGFVAGWGVGGGREAGRRGWDGGRRKTTGRQLSSLCKTHVQEVTKLVLYIRCTSKGEQRLTPPQMNKNIVR